MGEPRSRLASARFGERGLRDLRPTAAAVGLPPRITSCLTSSVPPVPKMESSTTTRTDFGYPSDPYKVKGVCPDREYPSSAGVDYCPMLQRPEAKREGPEPVPPMPGPSRILPCNIPKYKEVGEYVPSFRGDGGRCGQPPAPEPFVPNLEEKYKPNVDYSAPREDFTWPTPTTGYTHTPRPELKPEMEPRPAEYVPAQVPVPHQEPSEYIPSMYTIPKTEYSMVGQRHVGETRDYVMAPKEIPVANYTAPSYGAMAGGSQRPRFGAPSRDPGPVPVSDPSYPQPEYSIPPPQAGFSQLMHDYRPAPGPPTVPTPVVRYPDPVYNVEPVKDTPKVHFSPPPEPCPPPKVEDKPEEKPQVRSEETEASQKEPLALKGFKKIRTTNQTYGSWIDDPALANEKWYIPTRLPITKTYISRYKEEAGPRVWT